MGSLCGAFFTDFYLEFVFPATQRYTDSGAPPLTGTCKAQLTIWQQHFNIFFPNAIYEATLSGMCDGLIPLAEVFNNFVTCDGSGAVVTAEAIP